MRTRTFCTLLLVCAFLASVFPLAGVPAVRAQASPELGAAVPVSDEEGTQVGSISVTEVVDPFTEFDPSYPPEAGSRYVVLTVAIDADTGQRFDFAPYTIVLQDDQGFLWNQSSLYLTDEALIPELSSETLAPGSRVTGLIGFILPEDRAPARIFYQPESSRLVPLATLLEQETPVVGDAVAIPDSEGGQGSVTVTEVVDPFEDVEPGQVPPEGARFVLFTLNYENTSDGRFFVEPHGLTLRDSDGNLWSSTFVSRPEETALVPDLESGQLAPGDRVSGAVTFAVPADAGLAELYVSPVSGQLLVIADMQADAGAATEEPAEAATPVADAGDSAAATTEEASAGTVAATDACANLEQWLSAARGRLQQAATMSIEDATMTDLEGMAAHAEAYRGLAQEQLAETAPPEAEAAGKALAATLNAYGAAIEQILEATDPGKDTVLELTGGMNAFNDAGARLQQIEAELNRLGAACGL